MSPTLDLALETLEDIETPLTDREWGIIAGAAFAGGIVAGILVT